MYDSAGAVTRIGDDQLPGSCGELVGGLTAVGLVSATLALTIDCTDTPLVAPGGIHTRLGRQAARPEAPHWYPCLFATWWATNFPLCRGTRLESRHVMRAGPAFAPDDEAPLVAWPAE